MNRMLPWPWLMENLMPMIWLRKLNAHHIREVYLGGGQDRAVGRLREVLLSFLLTSLSWFFIKYDLIFKDQRLSFLSFLACRCDSIGPIDISCRSNKWRTFWSWECFERSSWSSFRLFINDWPNWLMFKTDSFGFVALLLSL